jgi:hypothetical protein
MRKNECLWVTGFESSWSDNYKRKAEAGTEPALAALTVAHAFPLAPVDHIPAPHEAQRMPTILHKSTLYF